MPNVPFIYRKETLIFYKFHGEPPSRVDIAGETPLGMALETYTKPRQVPDFVKTTVFPYGASILRLRMVRELAILTTLTADDEVVAYGWLQSWRSFQRTFGKIAKQGTMIGPAWTAPTHRGKGLHALMLKQRIRLCDDELPIFTFAEKGNKSSQKGILRTGFTPFCNVYLYRVGSFIKYSRVKSYQLHQ